MLTRSSIPIWSEETDMTLLLLRSASSLAAAAACLVLAAGVYTEAHRAPDQP
jgi:hypothetical protein